MNAQRLSAGAAIATAVAFVVAGICIPEQRYSDPSPPLTTSLVTRPYDTTPLATSPLVAAAQISAGAARSGADATKYAADRAAATARRQALRAGLLAIAAGILTALGLLVRWRAQEETESQHREEAERALGSRRDTRFATAIEHLANPHSAVQIGGIYTLEALAKEDPAGMSETVVQILTSFTEADRNQRASDIPQLKDLPNKRSSRTMRVAYAATVRSRQFPTELSLKCADLSGAELRNADLRGANLTKAHLAGADLTNAKLRRARLDYSNMSHANLTGADLTLAVLPATDRLSGAKVAGADLTYANPGMITLFGKGEPAGDELTKAHFNADRLKRMSPETIAAMQALKGMGTHPSHAFWVEATERA